MTSCPELVRDAGEPPVHDIGLATGRNVVVVIGIDRYEAWPYLANAVNDARGTARAFRRLGFTEVNTLLDGAATRDALHKLVTDDLATLQNTDSLVVFFAGHGGTRRQVMADGAAAKTGFIIPVDAEDKQGQVATWIRLDNWLADIARLPPKHILVILDACHSGIALDCVDASRGAPISQGDADGSLSRRRSRKVIVSALDDEVALDGGPRPGHSLFTGYLLEALTGGLASNGCEVATGTELGLYLHTRVTRARYQNRRQTPRFSPFEWDDKGELMFPVRSTQPAMAGASEQRDPDEGAGRLLPEAMPSLLDPAPDLDANAPLRARLADTLADLVPGRSAIAQLLAERAPQLRGQELPAGASAAIWSHVLVELTNAGALPEISAILDAVRDRSWRARRIDWAVFSALLRPRSAPAIASWSYPMLEIRRYAAGSGDGERAPDPADPAFITSEDALLEAVVTQHWTGARPPPPVVEVTSAQLFGETIPLLHQYTQLPSPEPATARWLIRIPVPRARIRTRRVTVRCAGTGVMEQRYIVPQIGSLCATALWLACAAAAVTALKPILPVRPLLLFTLVTAILGLFPSLRAHVLSKLTGRHLFRRLLHAWELAAPLTVVVVVIVFAVPLFFVLTTNATGVSVPVGSGRTIGPDSAPQTRLKWEVNAWHLEKLEEPFCQCDGSRRCTPAGRADQPCDPSASGGRFRQITLGCTAGRCDRLTHYLDPSGDARIIGPLGTKLSALRFGRGSLSRQMTLKAGDIAVEALDLSDSDTEQTLEMLPGQIGYDLDFTAPQGPPELLHCDTAANQIIRLKIDEPVPATEPPARASDPIHITLGQATSQWTGAAAQLRACRDDADGSSPRLVLETPEGKLDCHGGPIQRVLVLDPPAPAAAAGATRPPHAPATDAPLQITIGTIRSSWTPAEGSPAVRACLGSPGDVEIAGLAQGAAVTLPRDPAFQHPRVLPPRARAGAGVPVTCEPGATLRIVALQNVNARTPFRPGPAPVALLDGATGATCSALGAIALQDGTSCQLTEHALTCPAPRIRIPDCFYDKSHHSVGQILDGRKRAECPTRADGMDLSDARDIARDNQITCPDIYVCK